MRKCERINNVRNKNGGRKRGTGSVEEEKEAVKERKDGSCQVLFRLAQYDASGLNYSWQPVKYSA